MAYKARKLLSLARQVMPAQKLLLDELDLGARQMILAFAKARVAAHILAAVPREPGDAAAGFGGRALPPTLTVEVSDLLREWRIQRDEFERLWMARSRRSEIEQRLRLYRDREQELARLAMPESRGPFAPDLP